MGAGVPTPTISWQYNNMTINPFTVHTEVSGIETLNGTYLM